MEVNVHQIVSFSQPVSSREGHLPKPHPLWFVALYHSILCDYTQLT